MERGESEQKEGRGSQGDGLAKNLGGGAVATSPVHTTRWKPGTDQSTIAVQPGLILAMDFPSFMNLMTLTRFPAETWVSKVQLEDTWKGLPRACYVLRAASDPKQ